MGFLFLGLYILPTIVAAMRNKANTFPIFILNMAFGWTVIGWLVALIWAALSEPRRA